MTLYNDDTIAAVATASGRGGIGVIRVSGPKASQIAETLSGGKLTPRYAKFSNFKSSQDEVIDSGLVLYFPKPHSFTGEDVIEFQGHGGPVVLDLLLTEITRLGARLAEPGEFTRRAYLNDKIDLVQAEAIADLIDASSTQAAKSAQRSLQGVFSTSIAELKEQLVHLRMFVEAAIDFPEEEIDFLKDERLNQLVEALEHFLQDLLTRSTQGNLLREGINVVIIGRPNAGKSSLLNRFVGEELAIVTDIQGTTRDAIKSHYVLDGIPLHIFDTAGLRETNDPVERLGIDKTKQAIAQADLILLMSENEQDFSSLHTELGDNFHCPVLEVHNKIDQLKLEPHVSRKNANRVYISALVDSGIDLLKHEIKALIGVNESMEDTFIARRRHLDALNKVKSHVTEGIKQLRYSASGELFAEELRLAQQELNKITGEFSSDDLLGEIFSSFCIGK